MAINAPVSKSAKNWILIYIIGLIGFGVYCIYDGYFNESFIKEHTDKQGEPNSTLFFNQKSPPLFFIGAALLGLRLFLIRNRRITAEDKDLVINDKLRIAYDSIQSIDKTDFEDKGIFTVFYDNAEKKQVKYKFDCQKYDNLKEILELLIDKIT